MDYYSITDPRGIEGWVGWPTADSFIYKLVILKHRSGAGQGKSPLNNRHPNNWAKLPTEAPDYLGFAALVAVLHLLTITTVLQTSRGKTTIIHVYDQTAAAKDEDEDNFYTPTLNEINQGHASD